jgi:RNA recognition motif-containing protein
MKNPPNPRELFVTEISYTAEEEDLRKLFVLFGTVSSVHMVKDPKTKVFKGVAFVRMATPAQAKDACNSLDGTYLVDRCISVRMAKQKEPVAPAKKKTSNKKPATKPSGGRRK